MPGSWSCFAECMTHPSNILIPSPLFLASPLLFSSLRFLSLLCLPQPILLTPFLTKTRTLTRTMLTRPPSMTWRASLDSPSLTTTCCSRCQCARRHQRCTITSTRCVMAVCVPACVCVRARCVSICASEAASDAHWHSQCGVVTCPHQITLSATVYFHILLVAFYWPFLPAFSLAPAPCLPIGRSSSCPVL